MRLEHSTQLLLVVLVICSLTHLTLASSKPASPRGATQDELIPITRVSNRKCCKLCDVGVACGDTCISAKNTCAKPPGCACNKRDCCRLCDLSKSIPCGDSCIAPHLQCLVKGFADLDKYDYFGKRRMVSARHAARTFCACGIKNPTDRDKLPPKERVYYPREKTKEKEETKLKEENSNKGKEEREKKTTGKDSGKTGSKSPGKEGKKPEMNEKEGKAKERKIQDDKGKEEGKGRKSWLTWFTDIIDDVSNDPLFMKYEEFVKNKEKNERRRTEKVRNMIKEEKERKNNPGGNTVNPPIKKKLTEAEIKERLEQMLKSKAKGKAAASAGKKKDEL